MGLEGPRMLSSTVLASWVRKGLACFEASNARLKKKKSGGVGGAQPPPPISKHSARIMGLEGFECFQASVVRLQKSGGLGGGGGAQPPHLQTQCSHHGLGRASHAFKHTARIMGSEGPRML